MQGKMKIEVAQDHVTQYVEPRIKSLREEVRKSTTPVL